MMLGATAGEGHDEPTVKVVAGHSPTARESLRTELFYLRCFAVSAGTLLAVKEPATAQKILQSFQVLLHLLAPEGMGNLPPTESLGQQDKLIHTVLMMRHMKLLEEFRELDPPHHNLIMHEGASRFGTRQLKARNDAYKRALATGNVVGVGGRFATECAASGANEVVQVGVYEFERYVAVMREQLKSVRLTEQ